MLILCLLLIIGFIVLATAKFKWHPLLVLLGAALLGALLYQVPLKDVSKIISDGFGGILSAPPGVRPRPFEIILETPKAAPEALKQAAFVAALQSILENYRQLIAYAPNI